MPEIVVVRPEEQQALTVDWTRPFAPEQMTPLAFTPIYDSLTDGQRLRYNQNFALYVNEKIAYLEEGLSHFVRQVARLPQASHLKLDLLELVRDEERHAAGFRALNRKAAPTLYGSTNSVFVRPGKWVDSLTRGMGRLPTLFPCLLWVILLQEERSVYYSRLFVEEREHLEPHFVAIHERHSQDEAAHVRVDEALLEILWSKAPRAVRVLNGYLLAGIFREFLYLPKRAALEVVKVALAGHPYLPEMLRQVTALRHNDDFLATVYNRTTNPETLSLIDGCPELKPLAQAMAGYRR